MNSTATTTGWTRKRAMALLLAGGLLVVALTIAPMLLDVYAERLVTPPPIAAADDTSTIVLDRNGKLLRAYTTADGRWRLPVSHHDVDARYIKMLLAFEDKRFFEHGGVDVYALMRAAKQLLSNGRIISGGSTLTMQVARLLTGQHHRTAAGKFTQIAQARYLEKHLSKTQILDLYLRMAPFGGNIEGVRAASLAYFGKEPGRLSIGQAALLVALPQSPEARRPDRHLNRARAARDRVLDRAVKAGVISKPDAQRAKTERVPTGRRPFPMLAPHLSDIEITRAPKKRIHNLTIDRKTQCGFEKLAKAHAQALGDKLSAAIIAVDHATGDVIAYVGSPGYLDNSRLGAIDMIEAVRSPGSTLKPLVYALAFESGIAHPHTLIEDRPSRFGAYRPENFDQSYAGTVTIREALGQSRNIPAVRVLDAVGPTRFVARLKHFKAKAELPEGTKPSLAVALGGIGLRLKDLASVYTGFANQGRYVPLSHVKGERETRLRTGARANDENVNLVSPLAAWYVTDILKDAPPPPNARSGSIAYKTGTSYGYRDALAVGYDGAHTIAVWVGRADGTSTPGLLGRTAAAPILFDAFARISQTRAPLRKAPSSAVNASGGNLPPPLKRFGNASHTAAANPFIDNPVLIAFPPDRAILEIEHDDFPFPQQEEPTSDPHSRTGSSEPTLAPVILKAEGGAMPLTWLVDGKPIARPTNRRTLVWQPEARGFAKLTVIDAKGRADRVTVRLK